MPSAPAVPSEIAIAILAELVQVRRAPQQTPRIGGVVLAAGLSSRMGRNKLTAELGGKPLVRHAVEAALAGGLDPVMVVTGNEPRGDREMRWPDLPVAFVHNAEFANGLSTSLRRASRPARDCAGAMVLLGDMPGISPDLIGRVRAGFDPASGRSDLRGDRQGTARPSGPVGAAIFPRRCRLAGDTGRARPDGGA